MTLLTCLWPTEYGKDDIVITLVITLHCTRLYLTSTSSFFILAAKKQTATLWEDLKREPPVQELQTVFRSSEFSSVQSLSCVQLFATPWIAAHQASLSITNSRSLLNSCPSSWWCHPDISSSVIPFSSCPNPSQNQGLFQWVNSSHEVAKVLAFQL